MDKGKFAFSAQQKIKKTIKKLLNIETCFMEPFLAYRTF